MNVPGFIRLTRRSLSDTPQLGPVYIREDRIEQFGVDDEASGSSVIVSGGPYLFVTETPDEIADRLINGEPES